MWVFHRWSEWLFYVYYMFESSWSYNRWSHITYWSPYFHVRMGTLGGEGGTGIDWSSWMHESYAWRLFIIDNLLRWCRPERKGAELPNWLPWLIRSMPSWGECVWYHRRRANITDKARWTEEARQADMWKERDYAQWTTAMCKGVLVIHCTHCNLLQHSYLYVDSQYPMALSSRPLGRGA